MFPDGGYGCVANAGDSEHRKEIFRLAGLTRKRGRSTVKDRALTIKAIPLRTPDFERVGGDGHSRILRIVNFDSLMKG